MGREIQKKKNRSKAQPIRQAPKKAPANPLGNNLVAKNWDKKQTLTQNYRRLGLVSRLRGATGGIEKSIAHTPKSSAPPLVLNKSADTAVISEVKVERDANGNITRVLSGKRRENPLNDLLNDIEDREEEEEEWGGIEEEGAKTDVVRGLEEYARRPEVKRPRKVSEREQEWLERLVAKYGEDVQKMARDRRLNPMQQTGNDIARRIRIMNGDGK